MNRFLPAITLLALTACTSPTKQYNTWSTYGGSKEMIRYSSINSIDTNNISQLQLAWTYSTGDVDTANHSQIQCNPIMINGVLYGVSPRMKLFALDAATGTQKWSFDPYVPITTDTSKTTYHTLINVRGLTYWTDGQTDERLFYTAGSILYAIDAKTGIPIPSFGDKGSIDLHNDLDRDVKDLLVTSTTPGVIYKDMLIVGTRLDEDQPAAPGHVRAYDVRTGKRRWIFHTIPQPGEFGYETWEDKDSYKNVGGANSWSGFTLDEEKGIVFVPTGSAAYDFYGGKRKGSNLFANCLIALDAATGQRKWHFQFVHHDVWDKDLPTPPALVTLNFNGKKIEAVAQPTKHGMVYVFERETGKPVFDINEVPQDTLNALAGDQLWPTQPIPVKPAPFVRQTLTTSDINPYAADSARKKLQEQINSYRIGKMFIPPGKQPSLVFPGYDGGAEWGGPAFDPETGILYVNANEMAWGMEMYDNKYEARKKETYGLAGKRLYANNCSVCHGMDQKGTGNNPALVDINKKYTYESFITHINNGRRMMPAFAFLSQQDKDAIASFILDQKEVQKKEYKAVPIDPVTDPNYMPYKMAGYTKFMSSDGYPGITPPWGTLNAINLNTGDLVWKVPLGEYEALKAKGVPPTGTENYGGPVVTAGGLVFIAAARDAKMRAFNKYTGKQVWEYDLPAPGFATPAVFELEGRMFIVIACGGGKLGTQSSDKYLAFALPAAAKK